MSIRLHCAAVLTTCCASAMVGANGFSSNTCFPAFKASRAIGTCAGRLAVMSTASASTAARADSSVGKYRSGDRLRSCCARTSIPSSMSTHATSSTSSLCCITLVAQFRPQPPIPTCTRRIVIALSFSLRLSVIISLPGPSSARRWQSRAVPQGDGTLETTRAPGGSRRFSLVRGYSSSRCERLRRR